MTPYYQQSGITIHHGTAEAIVPTLTGITAIVTDPPAGIGFMGKDWDTFGRSNKNAESDRDASHDKYGKGALPYGFSGSGRTPGDRDRFIDWMTGIASAALDTLPPGGMALVWALPRTSHWTATAWEDAGWEVRDVITHHFGSGFPKSLAIDKAIDKHGGEAVGWFGKWLREWRTENGITQKEIAALFPSKTGGLTGCVANWELGFNMPTTEQLNAICERFNLPFESIEEAEREVIGKHETDMGGLGGQRLGQKGGDITTPATPAARQWSGYGTALKPATEFWHVFQKPIDGTYANNAVTHGVAGINVDGARVGTETYVLRGGGGGEGTGWGKKHEINEERTGRFPSNLILSGDDVAELFPVTGPSKSGGKSGSTAIWNGEGSASIVERGGHDDNGGSAARYFQRCDHRDPIDEASRIIYTAKASGTDRGNREEKQLPLFGEVDPEVANTHPTVKPLTLMEYLVTLVTMPTGTVILDMFGGSGSTAVSCKRLGVSCVMIEQDERYCEIAAARLEAS